MFIFPIVIIGIATFVICRVVIARFFSEVKRPDPRKIRPEGRVANDETVSPLSSMVLPFDLADQAARPEHSQPVHPTPSDLGSIHPVHAAHPVQLPAMDHSLSSSHVPMDQSCTNPGGHHHG